MTNGYHSESRGTVDEQQAETKPNRGLNSDGGERGTACKEPVEALAEAPAESSGSPREVEDG